MVASFASIYIPTLATVSTLIAAGTVYLARQDRREGASEQWVEGFQGSLDRLAECVIEVGDSHRREPARIKLARAKLRAALARLPNAGLSFSEVPSACRCRQ
jgi:hypothetical protein